MSAKESIIQACLQQFLKHGIRKMTVKKLSESLGLSTKTFYNHFADKEDLLKQCLLVHYSELSKKFIVDEYESTNPVIILYKVWHEAFKLDFGVTHVFYHDLNYYFPQLQDAVISKAFKKFPSFLKNLIENGIQEKYFKDNIEPVIVIETMQVLYNSITRTDRFKKLRATPADILQNTLELYIKGMCTQKGLIELENYYLASIE